MSQVGERISYWLIPAEPDKARLAETIQNLAVRWNGPMFEPHVTLGSGLVESRERIDEIVSEAMRGVSKVVLTSTGIDHSDQFTKTLFVEFAADDALTLLAAKLKRLSARPEEYELKPHLSLLYASLDQAQREALARSVVIPKLIRFDSLKAVVTGGSTCSRADVESWRVVAAQCFG